MDIRGNKGYLTVSEQICSELQSPIDFASIDIIEALKTATETLNESSEIIDADHNEGLPHERARAVKDAQVALSRKSIYTDIASELILRGELEARAVESIR